MNPERDNEALILAILSTLLCVTIMGFREVLLRLRPRVIYVYNNETDPAEGRKEITTEALWLHRQRNTEDDRRREEA